MSKAMVDKSYQKLRWFRPLVLWATCSILPSGGWAGETENPAAYFSFDSCDATDESGNGHHGVIRGGNLRCVDGFLGPAFEFRGKQYIELLDKPFLAGQCNLTITAWIHSQAEKPGLHQIFSGGDSFPGRDPITLQLRAGFYSGDDVAELKISHFGFEDIYHNRAIAFHPFYTDFRFETERWYALGVVLNGSPDSSDILLYINGQRIYHGAKDHLICAYFEPGMQINIGAIGGGEQGWIGYLDEIRIYHRVLSASEIAHQYSADLERSGATRNSGSTKEVALWRSDGNHRGSGGLASLPNRQTGFNVTLLDLEADGDLDAVIGEDPAAPESVWLRTFHPQHRSQYQRSRFFEPFLSEMQTTEDAYFYRVTTADLDCDGCVEAFVLHPLDGNELWVDNGHNTYVDGGKTRVITLEFPDDSAVGCSDKGSVQQFLQALVEMPWRRFQQISPCLKQ